MEDIAVPKRRLNKHEPELAIETPKRKSKSTGKQRKNEIRQDDEPRDATESKIDELEFSHTHKNKDGKTKNDEKKGRKIKIKSKTESNEAKPTSTKRKRAVGEKKLKEIVAKNEAVKLDEGGDFALNAAHWILSHNNVDLLMDLRDNYWCETVLGADPKLLKDLAGLFLRSHNVYADEKSLWGPAKWQYSEDLYDNFNFYILNGCPNCGKEYSTETPGDLLIKPVAALICNACGHTACPLHFDNESESLVDRVQMSTEEKHTAVDAPGSIYIRGTRRVHDFGQNGKEWWQAYFLPASYRLNVSQASMSTTELLGGSKGERVREVCDVCGHDEAFFATFQARSADEGLTIIYECTRCHSRKTFNN